MIICLINYFSPKRKPATKSVGLKFKIWIVWIATIKVERLYPKKSYGIKIFLFIYLNHILRIALSLRIIGISKQCLTEISDTLLWNQWFAEAVIESTKLQISKSIVRSTHSNDSNPKAFCDLNVFAKPRSALQTSVIAKSFTHSNHLDQQAA